MLHPITSHTMSEVLKRSILDLFDTGNLPCQLYIGKGRTYNRKNDVKNDTNYRQANKQ